MTSGMLLRAPRLREFLAYVSECMLAGKQDEVTEQQIGCRIFGRPEGYNHTEDNIVRVTARNLRAKLEEYYQTEGAGEEWIIEIPKGGYLPAFRPRVPVMETELALPLHEPARQPVRFHRRELIAWCLCGVLATGLLAGIFLALPRPKRDAGGLIPVLFPNASERVTVVMVDAGLQLYRSVAGRTVPLDAYLEGSYLQPGTPLNPQPLPGELVRFFRGSRDTTFSSAFIAAQIVQAMPPGLVEIRHPTQVNSRDFRRNHAILLGGPWSNPWAQPFEGKLNFQIETGPSANGSIIKNRQPRAGERESYLSSREGSVETSYVRIAVVPNLGGSGKVLLLGATTSGAMEAASEFLLKNEHLAALRQLLHLRPNDEIPFFELVLEAKSVDVTPHGLRVVAFRSPLPQGN